MAEVAGAMLVHWNYLGLGLIAIGHMTGFEQQWFNIFTNTILLRVITIYSRALILFLTCHCKDT